jgi:hypothetical protein
MSTEAMQSLLALGKALQGLSAEEVLVLEALATAHHEEDGRTIISYEGIAEMCGGWHKMRVQRIVCKLEALKLIAVCNRGKTHAATEDSRGPHRAAAFEYRLNWLN